MTREELLSLRKTMYDEYKNRIQLGDFDANSDAIRLCLKCLVDIINHTLEDMKRTKKKPDVH